MVITLESISGGIVKHIILIFIVILVTPLFTYFGLRRELRLIEQIIAILVVFLMVEVIIYIFPFILESLKSIL